LKVDGGKIMLKAGQHFQLSAQKSASVKFTKGKSELMVILGPSN
jgi:hypothetical protein